MNPSNIAVSILASSAIVGCGGCGGWSRRDTGLELAAAGVLAVDWRQTERITTTCDELNALIGPCGDRVPVNAYFPVAMIFHAGIAAALPPRWRTVFQAVTLGAEVNQVWLNRENGYDDPPTIGSMAPPGVGKGGETIGGAAPR